MLVRIFSYLVVIIIIFAIYGLFTIKDLVVSLRYQIDNVTKQVVAENNQIHILKAEQAYLISPTRLRKLSDAYLQLGNIKITQMITDPLVPISSKYVKSDDEGQSHFSKTSGKWRYKTNYNNKYIKTVSNKN
ncbi:MAG: hypothetical protein LN588_01675 [Rickettsia endosymbiont of Bryobia graminum]|nr:hypothetical protein [Rickettsia endosymbiont of Bryobia graminum]